MADAKNLMDLVNSRGRQIERLEAINAELLERLEELLEYSDQIKGSAVHMRCLAAIAKAKGGNHA